MTDDLPDSRPSDLPDEETREYADGLAVLLDAAGFPRMPARVLMALLTSPGGRLTAEQLSDVLDASRAAISGAIRYLESVQVIRVDSLPGTRRRMYRIAPDWYTVTLTRRSLYRELADQASERPPSLSIGTGAGDRVQEMADFYAFLDRRFPELFEEWRDRRPPTPCPPTPVGDSGSVRGSRSRPGRGTAATSPSPGSRRG